MRNLLSVAITFLISALLTSCISSDPDLNAQFFHEMAQNFNSRDGNRPRGVWNIIGAGFLQGMARGEEDSTLDCPLYDYDDEDYDI